MVISKQAVATKVSEYFDHLQTILWSDVALSKLFMALTVYM